MLIDWFTVIAQVINFLILVFLMKRFLYKPVLHAIDEREKLVAKRLREAQDKEKEAEILSDKLKAKIKAYDDQSEKREKDLNATISTQRNKLLSDAKEEALEKSKHWHESLRNEVSQLQQEIIDHIHKTLLNISRKLLNDLADVELEAQMLVVFIRKLSELSEEKKNELLETPNDSELAMVLKSSFELPPSQEDKLQKAIEQCFKKKVLLQYEVKPQLTSGVELSIGGQKIMWSIDSYLNSIEEGVHNILGNKLQISAENNED